MVKPYVCWDKNNMNKISLAEVEFIAHELARKTMSWDEPIPPFGTRYPQVLESCLAAPFLTFDKKNLYLGLINKAAVLFYLMVKNHPFKNGNKRLAVTSLLILLYKNNKWLKVDNMELYNFAKWVAESNPKLKDETIAAAVKFIKTYLVIL